MIRLEGKTALVTGGSRGIGAATCRLLADAGADVAIAYHRNREAARDVADQVRSKGVRAEIFGGDLSVEGSSRQLFNQTLEAFGQIDIVVANAGLWRHAPIDEMTSTQWRQTMAANLDSIYEISSEAARHMKTRKQGKIILISSTAGQRGEAEYSHYAASKGAVIAFTRSLAAELGPFNINVNSVAPGWVLTDMTEDVFGDEARAAMISESIPLKRVATSEDVAGPILFLASDLARHVQGAVINVNGGSVLC